MSKRQKSSGIEESRAVSYTGQRDVQSIIFIVLVQVALRYARTDLFGWTVYNIK